MARVASAPAEAAQKSREGLPVRMYSVQVHSKISILQAALLSLQMQKEAHWKHRSPSSNFQLEMAETKLLECNQDLSRVQVAIVQQFKRTPW